MISRLEFLLALPGLGFLRRFVPPPEPPFIRSPLTGQMVPRTWVTYSRVMSLEEVQEYFAPRTLGEAIAQAEAGDIIVHHGEFTIAHYPDVDALCDAMERRRAQVLADPSVLTGLLP